MAILFVSGVNDLSVIVVSPDDRGRPLYRIDGNASLHHRIPLRKGVAQSFLIFGKGVQQHSPRFATPPSLIVNQIADADTHRGALERCIELCSQLQTSVINHPANVLKTTREEVSSALQGVPGVVVPRTLRFQAKSPEEVFSFAAAEGFEFPFILRAAGARDGRRMLRLDSRSDLALLHALPFDGRSFYMTEFVDCRDDHGFYHKQRLAVIDGEPLLRLSLSARQWDVRAGSRAGLIQREVQDGTDRPEARIESDLSPRVTPACREISRRLGLEYFGIDCHMSADGRLTVFEAGANIDILTGHNPQRNGHSKHPVYDRVHRMLARHSGEQVI